MRRRTPKEEVSQRSEEGRVLVGLGLLDVVIPYRESLPKDFAFPIPYPYPHLQVFTYPVFDTSVLFYSLYALCMGFYFSQDAKWLRFRIEGVSVGKGFQRLGHAIAVGYTFLLFWYLFVALGWALIPPDLGLTYGFVSNIALFYIVSLMYDIILGRWGWTNHAISNRVKNIYRVHRIGSEIVLTRLWRESINTIPHPLSIKLIDFKLYLRTRPPRKKPSKKAWLIGIAIFVGGTALAVYLLEWYLNTLH